MQVLHISHRYDPALTRYLFPLYDEVFILFFSQGLRLNRALLFLSLSNNQIGDSGAAHLAAVRIYIKGFNLGDNASKSVMKLF